MAGQRTTVAMVMEILGGNYGTVNGVLAPLQPFIRKAHATTEQLLALSLKTQVPLLPTNEDLILIETYLAAFEYTMNDKQQANQSTAGASATFVKETLAENTYKAAAIRADPTGLLHAIVDRLFASTYSLGPTCP